MKLGPVVFASLSLFFLPHTKSFAAEKLPAGVEVGANINTVALSGSNAIGTDTTVSAGLIVGGYVTLPITAIFAVQPEVTYAQKHVKLSSGTNFSLNEKWDFVEIPVLAKLSVARIRNTSFYVIGGPGFSFTVHAKETDRVGGVTSGPDQDVKGQIQSADVSLMAGAGVTMSHFGLEGRYDAGLRNLNKTLSSALSVKERTLTMLARWGF